MSSCPLHTSSYHWYALLSHSTFVLHCLMSSCCYYYTSLSLVLPHLVQFLLCSLILFTLAVFPFYPYFSCNLAFKMLCATLFVFDLSFDLSILLFCSCKSCWTLYSYGSELVVYLSLADKQLI